MNTTSSGSVRAALAAASLFAGAAFAQPAQGPSRGEMLYAMHCTLCHTQQMHWRDQRAATDWPGLKFQVRRWQGVLSLGWDEADVHEVASYLNTTIYRFEQTTDTKSSRAAPSVPGAAAR